MFPPRLKNAALSSIDIDNVVFLNLLCLLQEPIIDDILCPSEPDNPDVTPETHANTHSGLQNPHLLSPDRQAGRGHRAEPLIED